MSSAEALERSGFAPGPIPLREPDRRRAAPTPGPVCLLSYDEMDRPLAGLPEGARADGAFLCAHATCFKCNVGLLAHSDEATYRCPTCRAAGTPAERAPAWLRRQLELPHVAAARCKAKAQTFADGSAWPTAAERMADLQSLRRSVELQAQGHEPGRVVDSGRVMLSAIHDLMSRPREEWPAGLGGAEASDSESSDWSLPTLAHPRSYDPSGHSSDELEPAEPPAPPLARRRGERRAPGAGAERRAAPDLPGRARRGSRVGEAVSGYV